MPNDFDWLLHLWIHIHTTIRIQPYFLIRCNGMPIQLPDINDSPPAINEICSTVCLIDAIWTLKWSTASNRQPQHATQYDSVGHCWAAALWFFGLTSMPIRQKYRSEWHISHSNTISITAQRHCCRTRSIYTAALCLCIGSYPTSKLNFHETSAMRRHLSARHPNAWCDQLLRLTEFDASLSRTKSTK